MVNQAMKRITQAFAVLLMLAAGVSPTFAQQNTFTATTLSQAVVSNQRNIPLASVTGISGQGSVPGNATDIYVDRELMQVVSVNTVNNTVTVIRGASGTQASAHNSGAAVLAGQPSWFQNYDPEGSCTRASTVVQPWINQRTGDEWTCSSVTNHWGPYFGTAGNSATPVQTGANATGTTITPEGPLITFNGTTALATITPPTGFNGGTVTIVFTGSAAGLTWTAAGNIAVAGTSSTAQSSVIFTWDQAASKWRPSRLT